MSLLIDGYNLLHVTGIFGKGRGPGGFQRSREALLRFLAASIEPRLRKDTTIVFDAADAPPGLPSTLKHEEILVRYARDYPDADALIEELIADHSSPRRLTVVSSDHRIQRAARRRRSQAIDSDIWYSQLWEQRANFLRNHGQQVPEKPTGKLSDAEVESWVEEFSKTTSEPLPTDPLPTSPGTSAEQQLSPESPFPPGYAEDISEDD